MKMITQKHFFQSSTYIYIRIFLPGVFLLLFNTSLLAQIEITRDVPDQDSLVRLVGKKNIDTTYSFQWDQDSSLWKLYRRNLHFYNEKHMLLTLLHQNKKDNGWENFERTIKSYNRKGNVIETLHQEWNSGLNDWVNLQLKTILYDKAGQKSEVLYQEWRKALGEWFSTVRYLIEYNRKGGESSVLVKTYKPETESWEDHQQYLFYYNAGYGPPDMTIVEKWYPNEQEWKKRGRYLMNYNFRGKKTSEIQATWNASIGRWVNGLKFEYDYEKNQMTDQIEYRWEFKRNEWFPALRKEMKYNKDKELEEEIIYRWNMGLESWQITQRFLYAQQNPQVASSSKEQ